ncbi:hypothetical protein HK104_002364 [Borealophlyctis nickersoniae]|nr:hypothetical protein HK104_002364 [Borealophlyctis nickersoniae]
MTQPKITLYNNWACPYAQRAAIALEELGVEYERVEIDLHNKPDWYLEKINPAGTVPALAVDGEILTESAVIAEFIVEQFGDKAMQLTPIERARGRRFVALFSDKVWSKWAHLNYFAYSEEETKKKATEDVLAGIREVNKALKSLSPSGPYILGAQFSYADIVTAPLATRLNVTNRLSGLTIPKTEEYARFNEWAEAVSSRPNVQKTLDEEKIVQGTEARRRKLAAAKK